MLDKMQSEHSRTQFGNVHVLRGGMKTTLGDQRDYAMIIKCPFLYIRGDRGARARSRSLSLSSIGG